MLLAEKGPFLPSLHVIVLPTHVTREFADGQGCALQIKRRSNQRHIDVG
jgi:hypothetical protein